MTTKKAESPEATAAQPATPKSRTKPGIRRIYIELPETDAISLEIEADGRPLDLWIGRILTKHVVENGLSA